MLRLSPLSTPARVWSWRVQWSDCGWDCPWMCLAVYPIQGSGLDPVETDYKYKDTVVNTWQLLSWRRQRRQVSEIELFTKVDFWLVSAVYTVRLSFIISNVVSCIVWSNLSVLTWFCYSGLTHCPFLCDKTCVVTLFGLSVISPVQYVVMTCACVHWRMKFAVAIVCLLMLNIRLSVSRN